MNVAQGMGNSEEAFLESGPSIRAPEIETCYGSLRYQKLILENVPNPIRHTKNKTRDVQTVL